jgi:hypothetical protein
MTDRKTKMLTRERGAWIQKGSHDVKRDDEMRSEGGLGKPQGLKPGSVNLHCHPTLDPTA